MSTSSTPQPGFRERVVKVYSDGRAYYKRSPRLQRFTWQGKVGPAFWQTASVLSLIINVILIIVMLVVVRYVFTLKSLIQDGLIGGLYDNFVLMDQANITATINVATTIRVQDTMPVVFDLPLNQDTVVVLVGETPINGATIYLNGAAVPIDLVLPTGTPLNINLDLVVTVSQTIGVSLDVPINLEVPVDIPLDQTELHQPFTGLQGVVSPYRGLLNDLPNSWQDIPLCKPFLTRWVCDLIFAE
jgi:hypothetical protein